MIDERKEELASLYALHLLEPEEARAFEAELRADAELRDFVEDLQRHAAALVHLTPGRTAPAHLREKILREFRSEIKAAAPLESKIRQSSPVVAFPRPALWLPWALAAGLAVVCGLLFSDRAKLKGEVATLEGEKDVCELKIATLDSMSANQRGVAIVAWDAAMQHGVVRIENMPPPAANEDYQLWIIDPKYPQPVSAGVINVNARGGAEEMFKPRQPINSADKFAVSIERKGGAPRHEGPIVMLSK